MVRPHHIIHSFLDHWAYSFDDHVWYEIGEKLNAELTVTIRAQQKTIERITGSRDNIVDFMSDKCDKIAAFRIWCSACST
jgi:hypothetical protein